MSKSNKRQRSRRRKDKKTAPKMNAANATNAATANAENAQKVVHDNSVASSLKSPQKPTPAPIFEAPTTSPILFGFLVALVATPALFGPYGQRFGYSPDLHMAAYIQVFSLLLLTLLFFSRHFSKRLEMPRAPALIPFALLFGWAMLSVAWTTAKYEAITDALDWTGAFVTGFLILLLVKNIDSIRKLIEAIAISGALLSLFGALQFLFGVDWVQQHVVPATTFSNKNMAGQYGLLTIPLMFAMFLISKDKFRIWLYAVSVSLTAAFIFYTRARGAWAAGVFGLIILLIFMIYILWTRKYTIDRGDKKIAAALIIPMFLMFGYLTPGLFGTSETVKERALGGTGLNAYDASDGLDLLNRSLSKGAISSTADIRLTIWANSIPMFLDHPLIGVGIGNWTVHYAAYQSWFKQDRKYLENEYHANAHNDYVELICELGIIGLILMLWCFIGLFIMLRALLFAKDTYDKTHTILAGSLALSLVFIGINAFFSFPLKQPVPIMLVIAYVALLCCLYGIKVSRARYVLPLELKSKRYIAPILGMGMATITVLVLVLQYNWFQSEIYFRNVLALNRSANANQQNILRLARTAHDYMPWRDRLLWSQATALLKLGNAEQSLPLYKQALSSYPYQQNSLANITSAYMSLGRVQEALYYYRQLMEIQDSNLSSKSISYENRLRYLDLLIKNGLYKKASEEIEQQRNFYQRIYDARFEKLTDLYESKGKAKPVRDSNLDNWKSILRHLETMHQSVQQALDRQNKERAKAEQPQPAVPQVPAEKPSDNSSDGP